MLQRANRLITALAEIIWIACLIFRIEVVECNVVPCFVQELFLNERLRGNALTVGADRGERVAEDRPAFHQSR